MPCRIDVRLDHPGAATLRSGTTAVLPVEGAARREAISGAEPDREPPRRRNLPVMRGHRQPPPPHPPISPARYPIKNIF